MKGVWRRSRGKVVWAREAPLNSPTHLPPLQALPSSSPLQIAVPTFTPTQCPHAEYPSVRVSPISSRVPRPSVTDPCLHVPYPPFSVHIPTSAPLVAQGPSRSQYPCSVPFQIHVPGPVHVRFSTAPVPHVATFLIGSRPYVLPVPRWTPVSSSCSCSRIHTSPRKARGAAGVEAVPLFCPRPAAVPSTREIR